MKFLTENDGTPVYFNASLILLLCNREPVLRVGSIRPTPHFQKEKFFHNRSAIVSSEEGPGLKCPRKQSARGPILCIFMQYSFADVHIEQTVPAGRSTQRLFTFVHLQSEKFPGVTLLVSRKKKGESRDILFHKMGFSFAELPK
jgi:hypothetical protein